MVVVVFENASEWSFQWLVCRHRVVDLTIIYVDTYMEMKYAVTLAFLTQNSPNSRSHNLLLDPICFS